MYGRLQFSRLFSRTGGLFPTESHEYEVFRFALSQHQDIPKLVPQVDMVKMGSSFSMTYACEYDHGRQTRLKNVHTSFIVSFVQCDRVENTAFQKFS